MQFSCICIQSSWLQWKRYLFRLWITFEFLHKIAGNCIILTQISFLYFPFSQLYEIYNFLGLNVYFCVCIEIRFSIFIFIFVFRQNYIKSFVLLILTYIWYFIINIFIISIHIEGNKDMPFLGLISSFALVCMYVVLQTVLNMTFIVKRQVIYITIHIFLLYIFIL